MEVYFDDFKVTQTKSPIVQTQDYYPFGLTFNDYQRENSVENKYKFQSQEHVADLGLNWDSFKWRNHQPDIGRFFNVDPLAEKYYYNSVYAFSENKVVAHRELEGLESESIHQEPVTNINVAPVWQSDVDKKHGDPSVVDHYAVTFTLQETRTSTEYDVNSIAISHTVETTVSTHTVSIPVGGTKLQSSKKEYMENKNITATSALAAFTRVKTDLRSMDENSNKTITKGTRQSGTMKLDRDNTKLVRDASTEKGKSLGLVFTKYWRMITSSESDSHKRSNSNPKTY